MRMLAACICLTTHFPMIARRSAKFKATMYTLAKKNGHELGWCHAAMPIENSSARTEVLGPCDSHSSASVLQRNPSYAVPAHHQESWPHRGYPVVIDCRPSFRTLIRTKIELQSWSVSRCQC